MSLDQKIEKLKKKINSIVSPENACSEEIVNLSQELDSLIVEKMRRNLF